MGEVWVVKEREVCVCFMRVLNTFRIADLILQFTCYTENLQFFKFWDVGEFFFKT